MDTATLSPDVFISYASADMKRAMEICRYLEKQGHSCWVAPRNIRSGANYGEEIIDGINRCRCFVLILSAAANASKYVQREVERAVHKAKPVFPIRIEDVLPSPALELHLAALQYVDASTGALRDHITELARQLSAQPGGARYIPLPPQPWWWRKRYLLGGAALACLLLLIGWLTLSTTAIPVPSQAIAPQAVEQRIAAMRQAALEQRKAEDAAKPGLRNCAQAHGTLILRCEGPSADARVHIRSAQGEEVTIAGTSGGNGAEDSSYRTSGSRSTFLPWLGVGSTARVESADGSFSAAQPLPDLDNFAASVNIPGKEAQAPPLFYTLAQWKPGGAWYYLFFAHANTSDVEWSVDDGGFIRVDKMPFQARSGGPFWIDASTLGDKDLTLRWRAGAEQWSTPVQYHADLPAARIRSVKPLQDLADSVACYRQALASLPEYIACGNRRYVSLGEIYDDLRWGTSPDDLHDATDFNYAKWIQATVRASWTLKEPDGAAHEKCKGDLKCESYERQVDATQYRNAKVSQERLLEAQTQSGSLRFTPWKKTQHLGVTHFLAVAPARDDLFFQATARGGGTVLKSRIAVTAVEPR